jgi:DNA-directed RNA polymerase subunit E'/Rpb7
VFFTKQITKSKKFHMFELIDIEDHIPLPAPTFPTEFAAFPHSTTSAAPLLVAEGETPTEQQQQRSNHQILADTRTRFRQALLSAIAAKFLFRVIPDVGMVVSIASLTQVADDVHLLPGQAKVWVQCTFTLVVFKPKVGDRIRATIVEQSPTLGIRLSMDFFDQIVVPPQFLVEGSEWEPTIRQWGIRDEAGAFIRYVNNIVAPTPASQQQQQQKENQQQVSKNEDAAAPKSPTVSAPVNSLAIPAAAPGSVICVVEKVMILSSSNAALTAGSSSGSGGVFDLVSDTNNNNNPVASNASTMKLVASFSACPGLGPEAWFEENS